MIGVSDVVVESLFDCVGECFLFLCEDFCGVFGCVVGFYCLMVGLIVVCWLEFFVFVMLVWYLYVDVEGFVNGELCY